ncbi:MAG: PDZ domain-containing protein [Bacteroidales bacterium]|nr:PDZ domain-containing protein [Bacteroidales bacterium]
MNKEYSAQNADNGKRKFSKKFSWLGLIAIMLVLSIGLYSFNDDKRNFSIIKNLDIFYSLFRELNSYYVDETDPEKLIKTGIDNMLESLDPYTQYIPETEMEDFRFMTTGEYAGIGSIITKKGDYIVINEPYEGFPAQKAGLKAGDKILEIDGESAVGKTTQQVSDKLKGPAKTKVKIKIDRPGEKKPLVIELTRENIQINAVSYYGMVNDATGLIVLNRFTQGCADEVKSALLNLKEKQGAKSLILDLRGNPGGLLDEAIKIVNMFVPKGNEIVSTKGKVKQWDKTYLAINIPVDTIIPLTVLINRGSASASEIVAGSLQDLDRAVIIGQRSFGKGLVQTTRRLSYNSQLKVTTAKYYIPSGRCIQAIDYTHRNDDGSVGYVPDTLISEFKTLRGRKVFDGGGVSPDIKVNFTKGGNISYALIANQIIFDYATDFVLQNEKINTPDKFELSNEEYNKFKEFVCSKEDFKYQSKTLEEYEDLIETAKKEDYFEAAKEQFETLKKVIALDAKKDLELFKKEIKEILSIEIVKRYYYQKGAYIVSLKNDKELETAIELLNKNNFHDYFGLLSGDIPSHAGDKRLTASIDSEIE